MAVIKKDNQQCWLVCEDIRAFHTAGGTANWWSYFGEKFGDSVKLKHRVTILLSNSTPRYIHKKIEYIHPLKNLYMSVQENSTCNRQKSRKKILYI